MDLSGEEVLDTLSYFDIVSQFDLTKDVQDISNWNTEKSRNDYIDREKQADERYRHSLEVSRQKEKHYQENKQYYLEQQRKQEEQQRERQKEEERRQEQRRMEQYMAELAYQSARQEEELNDLRRAVVNTLLKKKELTAAQCANYRYGDPLPE